MIEGRLPQPDLDSHPPPSPPTPLPFPAPAVSGFSRQRITAAAGVTAAIALLVGIGLHSVLTDPSSRREVVAAGFAEEFVFTFLHAAGEESEDVLFPFLGYSPSLPGMSAGSFYVVHTSVRELATIDDGWLATVRADLLERTDGGFGPAGSQHFAVRVIESPGGGLRAAALPTPIAAPPVAAGVPPRVDDLPEDPAITEAISAYLDWYLTGSARIGRLAPAGGFTEVDLVGLDLEGSHAAAAVLATTAAGHALRFEIELHIVDGAWQLSELSPESS